MRSFKSIATGKIYRYETNLIPSWDEVLVDLIKAYRFYIKEIKNFL